MLKNSRTIVHSWWQRVAYTKTQQSTPIKLKSPHMDHFWGSNIRHGLISFFGILCLFVVSIIFFPKRSNLMVYQTWCPMPDVICRFIIFLIFLVFLKCFTYEYMYVTMCVHAHVGSYPGRQEEGTAGLAGSCELTTQCGCWKQPLTRIEITLNHQVISPSPPFNLYSC